LGDLTATGNGVNSFWEFQSPLNSYSGTGIIPTAKLPPNNADFGPTHGHIEAKATLNGELKIDLSDPDQIVKVFFNKDEIHPVSGDPNWFRYWKDINLPELINYLTIPSIPVFDFETCAFVPQSPPYNNTIKLTLLYDALLPYDPITMTGTLGANNFFSISTVPAVGCPDFDKVITQFYIDDYTIKLGPGCSQADANLNDPASPYRGIHTFYRTVAHEAEHARIEAEVWSTGYASNWDMDNDGYRDEWEQMINDNLPPGACYQFSMGTPGSENDIYQSNYEPLDLGKCPPLYNAGTEYEEWRCRNVADNVQLEEIDEFDWSFDPNGINQGKQW
jgi:hypothetical protein